MNRDEHRYARFLEEMLGVVERVSGNLRHAYKQLAADEVKDQKQFAEGLLGPNIEFLEKFGDILRDGVDEFRKDVAEKKLQNEPRCECEQPRSLCSRPFCPPNKV